MIDSRLGHDPAIYELEERIAALEALLGLRTPASAPGAVRAETLTLGELLEREPELAKLRVVILPIGE